MMSSSPISSQAWKFVYGDESPATLPQYALREIHHMHEKYGIKEMEIVSMSYSSGVGDSVYVVNGGRSCEVLRICDHTHGMFAQSIRSGSRGRLVVLSMICSLDGY